MQLLSIITGEFVQKYVTLYLFRQSHFGSLGISVVPPSPLPVGVAYLVKLSEGDSLEISMKGPYMGSGKQPISFNIEINTLKKMGDIGNAVTTSLENFELIVEALNKATGFTIHKIVQDVIPPIVEDIDKFLALWELAWYTPTCRARPLRIPPQVGIKPTLPRQIP